ncbi:MAG: hypothetical protein H6721_20195 [Sandaracinus sp.]|nr:hypothetical protein [Sandaracinus sp.]MCB9634450.1 hypothetical protein [Sandaracinus sp.]
MFELEVTSTLRASADEVWDHASTMDGVNHELAPWVRMRVPRAARDLALFDAPTDREAFPSVMLAFGVLPFDVHHLALERIVERGFDEESWSWMQRRWRHERRVEPTAEGCRVTDRLLVEPRFAPSALVRPVVRAIFESRHRRLRRRFGAA